MLLKRNRANSITDRIFTYFSGQKITKRFCSDIKSCSFVNMQILGSFGSRRSSLHHLVHFLFERCLGLNKNTHSWQVMLSVYGKKFSNVWHLKNEGLSIEFKNATSADEYHLMAEFHFSHWLHPTLLC